MIELQSLTKTYGGFRAVDDVSFTARPGRVWLGPPAVGRFVDAMRSEVK